MTDLSGRTTGYFEKVSRKVDELDGKTKNKK